MRGHIILKIIVFSFLLIGVFSIISCRKADDHVIVEIPLSNKSLDSIKMYIHGNWKLAYIKGGWDQNGIYHFKENYMTIFPNDSISWVNGPEIWARCVITYKRANLSPIDSTYFIQVIDYGSSGPTTFYAVKKRDDTLILRTTFTEPNNYYFVPK